MTDEEYNAFYLSSFSPLVRQIYAMTGDFSEAQDAVQEAFVRGWAQRARLSNEERSPEAWIRTVAWRLAVSRWRRALRGRALERKQFTHQDIAGPGPEHTALVAALRKLPAAQRQAVVLFHLCDLSLSQISEETGAAIGTVKARLSRGRAAMAEYLGDEEGDRVRERALRGTPAARRTGRGQTSIPHSAERIGHCA
ncbi:SigE family RNA polymerase sigma factor [Kitasatospora sp. NPDC049258]|uniref:SigE family RNA polymerase sigma factor n=1 Tax=Kitasatospora sp. NPDC049258 TaxID=3155394 RepID=UPI003422E207